MIAIHNHRQKSIGYNSTQVPPQIDSLIEYFDSTWINGQFQFQQGNNFDFSGPCTNNHIKGCPFWSKRASTKKKDQREEEKD